MQKEILLGMLAVAIALGLAAAGYPFGKYLAKQDATKQTETGQVAA